VDHVFGSILIGIVCIVLWPIRVYFISIRRAGVLPYRIPTMPCLDPNSGSTHGTIFLDPLLGPNYGPTYMTQSETYLTHQDSNKGCKFASARALLILPALWSCGLQAPLPVIYDAWSGPN